MCAAGRHPTEIAAVLFCSRSSVYRTVRAYRAGVLGWEQDDQERRVPLMLEYEAVLKRDDMRAQSHLAVDEVDVLLDMLAAVGTPHIPSFRWRPQLPDPDAEMILELAVNARADAIITMNTQDFLPAAGTFGVGVLRSDEFLRRLQS